MWFLEGSGPGARFGGLWGSRWGSRWGSSWNQPKVFSVACSAEDRVGRVTLLSSSVDELVGPVAPIRRSGTRPSVAGHGRPWTWAVASMRAHLPNANMDTPLPGPRYSDGT